MNKYAGCNHVIGQGFHMSVGNPSFVLRYRGKEWICEWHYYFGPMAVSKKTGDMLKTQPSGKSRFWVIAQWWFDQGAKVIDGVGVWKFPPIVEKRFTRINKIKLIENPKGDVVRQYYEGYEHITFFK